MTDRQQQKKSKGFVFLKMLNISKFNELFVSVWIEHMTPWLYLVTPMGLNDGIKIICQ